MNVVFFFVFLLGSAAAKNSTKDATEDIKVQNKENNNSTKEILKASESGDPAKAEIVKQIKRLNEDGSYTVGYEADDGTFKIESRDVLGNVKGTFGYVDRDGEIKRVTYSSSSEGTPVPVTTTTTTPSMPHMIVRVNKTVSSTTRRPLGTIVYPTRSSHTTRATVIQPIPRRRNVTRMTAIETTTERQHPEQTTSNILNLYKSKSEDITETKKLDRTQDDLVTKQSASDPTTKLPHTVKPVYEHVNEKGPETKANTIRRELSGTSPNPHMIHLQQSAGDDSTDIYGGHHAMGTVRPLFTTTTPRSRLVPFQTILAQRQKLQQQFPNIPQDEQETTIEASTGRVFEHENVVTSNPVPVIHIPQHRGQVDERYYQQPVYHRPPAAIHFRTREYLKDNPGAPVPIGNQRPFLNYELQNNVLEPQFIRENKAQPQQAKETNAESVTISPYEARPLTRIIPVPVDERGIPIQGYQGRYVNQYRHPTQQPAPPVVHQPHPRLIEPVYDDMNTITTPISTRDLKRLLQILIFRQNRLQALMDQLVTTAGPRYQPVQLVRQQQFDYNQRPQQVVRYQNMVAPRYQEEDRYDYRFEQDRQQQQEVYYNQVYDPQYESQRYVPRRRLYTRPVYDNSGSSSNQIEETPEYLPADVREALLLKMLMLAISPHFMPTPVPATELTTAAPPPRKPVRNIQILGEEGSVMDQMKRPMQRH